jgi:hypothetical protein
MDVKDKLEQIVSKYGPERILTWLESRVKTQEKLENPSYRESVAQRAKEKRLAERNEIIALRAKIAELEAK